MRPRLAPTILVLAGLAPILAPLVSCGGQPVAAGTRGSARQPEAPSSPGPQERAVSPVRMVRAETGTLQRTVRVAGTLAADLQADLGMKVAGRLELVPVDLGSRVRLGQTLARLAQPDFVLRVDQARHALEQARVRLGLEPEGNDTIADPARTAGVREADAQLRQAKLAHDRSASLFAQQLISQSDMDAAEAAYLVAEARRQDALEEARNRLAMLAQRESELAMARQQLIDSTLTAPFDGVVRERRVVAGNYVAVGQPLLVLVKVDPLRLRLAVPEREAAGLSVGQPVRLTVEGDTRPHTGRLARLSPALAEDSRTLPVEAEVPNFDGSLRAGSFVRAEIVTRAAEPAILVPASSLVTFAGIDKVLGVARGKVQEHPVRTGRREEGRVEILEGIAPGEPIIANPGNLVGGQAVRVVP